MAKTGRPPKGGQNMSVRFDSDVWERLNEYVRQQSAGPGMVSKNSVVNWALKKFLENPENNA